jgi:hypothetical protein
MNLTWFFRAIKTRLQADTGTGGLFVTPGPLVTGCYSIIAPPNLSAAYPYLLIDHEGDAPLDGFGLNMVERSFRVHIWAVTSIAAALDAVEAIGNRVYGDGNRAPAYGLHRHTLAFAGGSWTGGIIEYRDTVIDPDQDYYHIIQRYVTRFQKTAS